MKWTPLGATIPGFTCGADHGGGAGRVAAQEPPDRVADQGPGEGRPDAVVRPPVLRDPREAPVGQQARQAAVAIGLPLKVDP